jgi:hypothetical protein
MSYIGAGQNKYTVFPLENYTFGHKGPKVEKQRGLEARFRHLREKCAPFSFPAALVAKPAALHTKFRTAHCGHMLTARRSYKCETLLTSALSKNVCNLLVVYHSAMTRACVAQRQVWRRRACTRVRTLHLFL